jgi:hypothetical protein
VSSFRNDSRINGRPIQNATTVVQNTYTSAIQNSAFGTVKPKIVNGPARPHRIGVNDTTETIEVTAPNTSVWDVPTVGVFVSGPVPVVKMSTSCWMR